MHSLNSPSMFSDVQLYTRFQTAAHQQLGNVRIRMPFQTNWEITGIKMRSHPSRNLDAFLAVSFTALQGQTGTLWMLKPTATILVPTSNKLPSNLGSNVFNNEPLHFFFQCGHSQLSVRTRLYTHHSKISPRQASICPIPICFYHTTTTLRPQHTIQQNLNMHEVAMNTMMFSELDSPSNISFADSEKSRFWLHTILASAKIELLNCSSPHTKNCRKVAL